MVSELHQIVGDKPAGFRHRNLRGSEPTAINHGDRIGSRDVQRPLSSPSRWLSTLPVEATRARPLGDEGRRNQAHANNPPSNPWLFAPPRNPRRSRSDPKPRSAHGWRGGRSPGCTFLQCYPAWFWPGSDWQISTRHVCLLHTEGVGGGEADWTSLRMRFDAPPGWKGSKQRMLNGAR